MRAILTVPIYYRPGMAAQRPGVEYPANYHQDCEVINVLALPFKENPMARLQFLLLIRLAYSAYCFPFSRRQKGLTRCDSAHYLPFSSVIFPISNVANR